MKARPDLRYLASTNPGPRKVICEAEKHFGRLEAALAEAQADDAKAGRFCRLFLEHFLDGDLYCTCDGERRDCEYCELTRSIKFAHTVIDDRNPIS